MTNEVSPPVPLASSQTSGRCAVFGVLVLFQRQQRRGDRPRRLRPAGADRDLRAAASRRMLPTQQYRDALLTPPVWQEGGKAQFLLGTDAVGRDMLSRLIYGARYSLFIGLVVVTLALISGVILGLLAGYFRGWVDALIMRIMDIILAFPSLLLALVLVAILGPGLFNAMLAIALVLQPHFARLTRAAVMAEKNREYVIAAKVAGAGHLRLMFVTILPNCLAPLIVQATLSLLERHPRGGGARLPRHGRAAADARMGHDAGRWPASSSCAPGGS